MWLRSGKTIKGLAKELGVNPDRVRRAFKAWCEARKVSPERFLVRTGPLSYRYNLPQKFVNDFTRAIKNERNIVLKAGPNGEPIRITE